MPRYSAAGWDDFSGLSEYLPRIKLMFVSVFGSKPQKRARRFPELQPPQYNIKIQVVPSAWFKAHNIRWGNFVFFLVFWI